MIPAMLTGVEYISSELIISFITVGVIFLLLVLFTDIYFHALFNLQRHDIIKKRIDAHGNVIEARQDGIGAPKVNNKIFIEVHLFGQTFFIYLWINLGFTY